jgi:uncharacterized repeat protein (TIGR02543 family)
MSQTVLTYNPAYNGGFSFTWSNVTFTSTDGGLTYTGSPTVLTTPFPNTIPGNNVLRGVTIGNIVTSIGSGTFALCAVLTSIVIPNSVTSIESYAFVYCTNLVSINIPDSVLTIDSDACAAFDGLARVYISNATAQRFGFAGSPIANPPGVAFYNAPNNVAFEAPPTYTVTYDGNGNTGGTAPTDPSSPYASGSSVTVLGPGTLEKTGYTFNHWNTASDDTGISYSPGDTFIINSNTTLFAIWNDIVCFKEGTKILTDKGYVLIQELRKDDLVKTISSSFKKIEHIGYSKMYHNVNDDRIKNKLYRCSTTEYPELIEDLIITGGHSILVKEFKDDEQMEKNKAVFGGSIPVIDEHFKLLAFIDDKTKIFEEEGVHTVWHFALENTNDLGKYGVYANGLLVETIDINGILNKDYDMTLLE